jgi:hypothetical protein
LYFDAILDVAVLDVAVQADSVSDAVLDVAVQADPILDAILDVVMQADLVLDVVVQTEAKPAVEVQTEEVLGMLFCKLKNLCVLRRCTVRRSSRTCCGEAQ